MKKIYTIIFASCLAAISLSSCSDWLDVRPADEIKEEYLFETGNGYRTALNGIYRKLATFDLYGSNLSWGLIGSLPSRTLRSRHGHHRSKTSCGR